MAARIKIDPEFSKLIPAVNEDGELEREVLADGRFTEPVIVWKGMNILLDGHRRMRIAAKHPNLYAPKPVELEFEDRQAAHDWIIRHQLAKRNVSDEQRRYLIGKLYRDQKLPPGKPNSVTVTELKASQIAEETGVSVSTLQRNADFAEAVDSVPAPVKKAVLSGTVAGSTKDLETLSELPPAKKKAAVKKIASGEVKSVKEVLPKPKPKADDKPAAFDDKAMKAVYGQLVRMVDARYRALGGATYRDACHHSLGEFLHDLDIWIGKGDLRR